jgi:vacuolar-type H+-ATPase subunit F/Vma7
LKVAVFGSRQLVFGFRLAGIDAQEVEPSSSALNLLKKTAEDREVAIIILGQTLFHYLKDEIHRIKLAGPIPSIISLPEPSDSGNPQSANKFMEEFLGISL